MRKNCKEGTKLKSTKRLAVTATVVLGIFLHQSNGMAGIVSHNETAGHPEKASCETTIGRFRSLLSRGSVENIDFSIT